MAEITGKIYFSGCTGYAPLFQEIGNRLGPMRLSFIPVGGYSPRWLQSVGMHWATFNLTDEHLSEPPVHGQVLPLRGTSRLVWMRIVTVYDAALYLHAEVPRTDSLTDVPKRLELRYHVSIKGTKFGESAEPYLEKNVALEALARLRPRIEQLNRLYRDVREGDRYALTYAPGKGTTLSLNNEPLGTIERADFAAAYYAIWLGAKPISDSMRNDLTGTTTKK